MNKPYLAVYGLNKVLLAIIGIVILIGVRTLPNTGGGEATAASTPIIDSVKITSPSKGQHVPIGSNLIVSGTSSGNANSNCEVSVIVDSIKPYQQVIPTGTSGADDYSKWSFTVSPKYTTINEGENEIIAKYSCSDDPSAIAFDTVNVLGAGTSGSGSNDNGDSNGDNHDKNGDNHDKNGDNHDKNGDNHDSSGSRHSHGPDPEPDQPDEGGSRHSHGPDPEVD